MTLVTLEAGVAGWRAGVGAAAEEDWSMRLPRCLQRLRREAVKAAAAAVLFFFFCAGLQGSSLKLCH